MLDEQVDDALVARVQRVVAGALPAPVDRVPRRACVVVGDALQARDGGLSGG